MTMTVRQANALSLERELEWFNAVLEARIGIYFQHDPVVGGIDEIPAPELPDNGA